MTKLKLGPLPDHMPLKVALELPAPPGRDLVAHADYATNQHVFVSLAGEDA